jgi:DNA-binding HxlR family transcriptional regulator
MQDWMIQVKGYAWTVTTPRGYQSFCPLGAALNVVGERWALLIVRDLMLGPRRYSDLLHGLGGVGTDILAARLRGLESAGVVKRTGHGRAQRYELTTSGQALRPVVLELSRWGVERLELPDDPSDVPLRIPLTALLVDPSPLPQDVNGIYEIRVGSEIVVFEVMDGNSRLAADMEPTTIIEMTPVGLRSLIMGVPTSRIAAAGDLYVEGDGQAASDLLETLASRDVLSILRRRFQTGAEGTLRREAI